jgi:hypothetical protein
MKKIPEIDLHPEKIQGTRPENALAACRNFLQECVRQQAFEARIITGFGLHGDGTPRLRMRVEREVLPSFQSYFKATGLEQGGAVIHVWFQNMAPKSSPKELARLEKERNHRDWVKKEERLMVAWQRYHQAQDYFLEDDLRRARLKVNQVLKELFPNEAQCQEDNASLRAALKRLQDLLEALEA